MFYNFCFLFLVFLANGCQREAEKKLGAVKVNQHFEQPFKMIFNAAKAAIDSNFIKNNTVILIEANKRDEVWVVILDK